MSAVSAALVEGYRHIDTAQSYNNEAEVGEGLRAWCPTCKCIYHDQAVARQPRLGYALENAGGGCRSVQVSAASLSIDTIDLLLVHAPFGGTEGRLNCGG